MRLFLVSLFVRSLVYSYVRVRSFVCLSVGSFIYSCDRLFVRSTVPSFVRIFFCPLVRSFVFVLGCSVG